MKRNSDQGPCDIFSHGEVEDYSVVIVPLEVAIIGNSSFGVNLFPNPANDHITIEFNQEVAKATIDIIDLSGGGTR